MLPKDGRLLALDPGTKRCGIAITDELRITARPLEPIERRSWKKLLQAVKEIVEGFDAKALVIGLPLESDGSDGPMTIEARDIARKFGISLKIPVFLQDERLTSYEARSRIWKRGTPRSETVRLVDSEAAAVILGDFLDRVASGPTSSEQG